MRTAVLDDGAHEEGKKRNAEDGATAVHTKDTEVKDHLANSILKDRINLGLYECSLFAEMAGFQGLFNRVFGTHECFDAVIGNLVHTLDEAGKSSSPESFHSMKKDIQANPHLQPILERYLTKDNPKVCLAFGADIGHVFVFSVAPAVVDRLVLHMWAPGSQIIFYENSHQKEFKSVQASNGLLEIAEAAMRRGGCNKITARMDKGGL
ncbi:hypothetical protein CCM_01984 [Cordyceps militaris CM01]|uniref:Uncharacterized protein n=1 Tax=Cordyceps militaris (strain CM01) TaxID=983644 RepID=G3JBZ7_CORMM|nr:uncharacterized protein CCM_01984 [Cordyceps militaris CM01]EGX93715.1 hypothetical protein CCM_01984 [Cordyceps militaris CM01]